MINTFERREKKMLVDEAAFPVIEKRLSEHFLPDSHNVGGKPYEICNIYFDNDSFDLIRHSVSKPKFKEKLRLRSYGTPSEDSEVFFEIKRKLGQVGTKRRAVLPLCEVSRFICEGKYPDKTSFINTQVLREISYMIDTFGLHPSVYIGYMRNAYFGKEDSSLRLTVDRDILTRRGDLFLEHGRYGKPLLPEGKLLIELKFSDSVPLWFADIMSEFGLVFHGYSKVGREFISSLQNNERIT